MKYISRFNSVHKGKDIYIIGTGPSLRLFPLSFFKNKITIGLNMAWKMVDCDYCITIHPDLNIPYFLNQKNITKKTKWITGHRKCRVLKPSDLKFAEKNFYFFEYDGVKNTMPSHEPSNSGRILDWVKKPSKNNLYLWSSISQPAVNLAANMGAKNIFLVGCDNGAILNNHHSHVQHTRWKGVDPNYRYKQYYEGLAEIRPILRDRNINLLNLSGMISCPDPDIEYKNLCSELNLNEHLKTFNLDVNKKTSSFTNLIKKLWKRLKY